MCLSVETTSTAPGALKQTAISTTPDPFQSGSTRNPECWWYQQMLLSQVVEAWCWEWDKYEKNKKGNTGVCMLFIMVLESTH